MLTIQPLDGHSLLRFILLLETGLRRSILDRQDDPGQRVLGASFLGQPVGVAVVHVDSEAAALTDLYVLPNYRRGGIGRRLLAAVEEQVRRAGVSRMQTHYKADEQTPHFERLLAGQGWDPPIVTGELFWTRCAVAFGPWVSRYRFRPPYSFFAWPELTAAERDRLLERGAAGWYPPNFSPFSRPDDAWDPLSSVGLRRKGEVVGWCLTVRESQGQMLVDILFVDPPLQRLGKGFMLVGEVIRRYCADGGDYAYWRVNPRNEAMLRWSRKAFAGEALVDQYAEWYSEKTLLQ